MKRILIIEDNPVNMKLFADLLEAKNYKVFKEYDGEAGYEALSGEQFDLLILDIQLPKLNGFELIKRAQSEGLKLPKTIIVSAFAMDNEINLAKTYGINSYITKPVDVVKFLKTVERLSNIED